MCCPPGDFVEAGAPEAAPSDGAPGTDSAVEAGGPCTSNADCDLGQHLFCGFPTGGGCGSPGTCVYVLPGGCACDAGGALVCNCAGERVAPSCCYPDGYQPFPLAPASSCLPDSGGGQDSAGSDGATDAGAE